MSASRRGLAWAAAVVVIVALVCGAWALGFADFLLATANHVHERYGIDLGIAASLFVTGEILFCVSIAMMLRELGKQVTWASIREFKFHELQLGSRRMVGWLWVNRLSWVVPWLIVAGMSISKVPLWATGAALVEVGLTLAVGIAITAGLRLPWWNQVSEGDAVE